MSGSRKLGNVNKAKYQDYLKMFLEECKDLRLYEVAPAIRAFTRTLKWFIVNCVPFKVEGFCEFKIFDKKESTLYIRYLDKKVQVPAHLDAKIVPDKLLKDYLNKRGKFVGASHREILPDGTKRKGLFDAN